MCYIGMLFQLCALCMFELLYVLYRYAGPSVCSVCF